MTQTKALTKEGKDVLMSEETTVFVLDTSGSMGSSMSGSYYSSGGIQKIDALRKAVAAVIEERMKNPDVDKLGIIEFSGNDWSPSGSQTELEYAFDANVTRELLPPGPVEARHLNAVKALSAGGGTPMYYGLLRARAALEKAEGMVRIILVTDGCPTGYKDEKDIKKLVKSMAEDYGYVVDTVGIGARGRTVEYKEGFLRELAKLGEGEFYPVEDADELLKYFLEMERERRALMGGGIKLLQAAY